MCNAKVACLLLGGPTLQIHVRGKLLPFELHPYCGPHPLHKRTGDPLERIPPGFWNAINLWERGGKLMNGEFCVVPDECRTCEGRGDEIKHIGGKHWEIVGKCKACDGHGVVFKELGE